MGGRISNVKVSYDQKHPVIVRGGQQLTKLLIRAEHSRLLHGGPNLTLASLSNRFHIVGGLKAVRSVTRQCVMCRRCSGKPSSQLVGQLPRGVTPETCFWSSGRGLCRSFDAQIGPCQEANARQVVCLHFCVYERKGSPSGSSHWPDHWRIHFSSQEIHCQEGSSSCYF